MMWYNDERQHDAAHPKTSLINYPLLEPLYPVYCDIRLRLMNVALGGCLGPQDIFLPLMYLLIINWARNVWDLPPSAVIIKTKERLKYPS